MWTSQVVFKSVPKTLNDKKSPFQALLKVSRIAEQFTYRSTKCSCVMDFGISPYFCSLLHDDVQNAPSFMNV